MASILLDRSNWAQVQYSTGAPSASTPGNIYINESAGGGLYVKVNGVWVTTTSGVAGTAPSIEDGLCKFSDTLAQTIETCHLIETRTNDDAGTGDVTLSILDPYDLSGSYQIIKLESEVGEGSSRTLHIGNIEHDLRFYSLDGPRVYINGVTPYRVLTEAGSASGEYLVPASIHVYADTDTDRTYQLTSSGTYAATTKFYVGTRSPSGAISAATGTIYFRVDGSNSNIYVNTSAATGTTWTALI